MVFGKCEVLAKELALSLYGLISGAWDAGRGNGMGFSCQHPPVMIPKS